MAYSSSNKAYSSVKMRRKVRGLLGTFLFGAVLVLAARILWAQKAEPLPADPEPPRLDLLPSKMQPKGIDLKRIAPTPPSDVNSQDYIISPDDELTVNVLDVPELTKMYRVSPTGAITVPLLPEPVPAAGLTLAQLGQSLEEHLQAAGMVTHPHITVQVTKSRLHQIAIAGAVKKPQMYEVYGKTTVLDALAQAEGLADDAGNTAIITRGELGSHFAESEASDGTQPAGGTNSATVHIDVKRLLEDGNVTQNLQLYPGDRVSVQRAGIFYVVGAVNKPGGFIMKDDRQQMTVLKALALSEYTKSTAAEKKTIIVRQAPKAPGGTLDIPVELDKILQGRSKDRVLLANDILFIPESKSRIALHRAAEAAASGASLLFYRIP